LKKRHGLPQPDRALKTDKWNRNDWKVLYKPEFVPYNARRKFSLRDRMRPPKAILYFVLTWCALVFIYGLVKFPDAPYKPCGSIEGYCGKTGKPHTESEFRQSKAWERTLLISFPFALASAIVLRRQRMARKIR
jgi:hypothetical protein